MCLRAFEITANPGSQKRSKPPWTPPTHQYFQSTSSPDVRIAKIPVRGPPHAPAAPAPSGAQPSAPAPPSPATSCTGADMLPSLPRHTVLALHTAPLRLRSHSLCPAQCVQPVEHACRDGSLGCLLCRTSMQCVVSIQYLAIADWCPVHGDYHAACMPFMCMMLGALGANCHVQPTPACDTPGCHGARFGPDRALPPLRSTS